MLIRRVPVWALPEAAATPEAVYLDRRNLLGAMGLGALAFGLGLGSGSRSGLAATAADPSAGLYPAARNEKFTVARPITDEATAGTYNNFYEFGSQKEIWRGAAKLPLRPWTVHLDGLVEAPREIGIDDLLKAMRLEERVIRHRCVEAWSMTVPWTGFPLKDLVALAKPLSSAKYVRFETFEDDTVASGQLQSWYPWPYVEALTMAEATNELAFMVTGAYGKPAAPQFGAPLRLHTPWKYGFKSIKSVVRITFTEARPVSFWEKTGPEEYGFWANVNPQIAHPRWSQATERVLGTGERVPTALFNGYGAFVADLYKDMEGTGERLWM